MEQSEATQGNQAFGSYLKKVREGRRLSLDAVEELSAAFPEKVTKSHLSRIENGLALPSFPRLMALSHIYGMPIASLAERYELDLRRGMAPVDLGGKSDEDVLKEADGLRMSGMYAESLALLLAILDRHERGSTKQQVDLGVRVIYCLYQTRRLELAKTLTEELLSSNALSHLQSLQCLHLFALCCKDLGRHAVALMALDRMGSALDHPETPRRAAADLCAIRGSVYQLCGDAARAIEDLGHAKQQFEALNDQLESCRLGLMYAEALIYSGRYPEAGKAIQAELVVAERNGFERLRATAISHQCLLAYKEGKAEAAELFAIRSNTLARPMEHVEVVFRNCFYLWRIAEEKGDAGAARANERALRSMIGRLEGHFSEADEFRRFVAQGDRHEKR